MNAKDAMIAACRALNQIDRLAEDAINYVGDPDDAIAEIHEIAGTVIGKLARAGYSAPNNNAETTKKKSDVREFSAWRWLLRTHPRRDRHEALGARATDQGTLANMTFFQRLCTHPFGWSYNTSRRIRFCRLCAQPQVQHAIDPATGLSDPLKGWTNVRYP